MRDGDINIFGNLPQRNRRLGYVDNSHTRGVREVMGLYEPEGPLPPRPHRSGKGGPSINQASAVVTYPPYPVGATALYSMRKTSAAYAGPCIQVFRVSDSAVQDIGFSSSGLVDIAAALAFSGVQPIFVQRWYDQSGSGNHLISTSSVRASLQSINGVPWLSTANNNYATAAALSLAADLTIGLVGSFMSDIVIVPVSQFDGTNGWFLFFNGSGTPGAVGATPGNFSFYSSPGAAIAADSGRYFARTNRYAVKRTGGTATIYVNGSSTATQAAANGGASTSQLTLGQPSSGFINYGLIGELYIYGSALTDTNRLAIDASQSSFFLNAGFSTPYSGTSAVEFGNSEQISCGSVLAYERTNTWTVFAAIQAFACCVYGTPTIIYSNVPASGTAFPGHEIWIDSAGHLRVRLINNFGTNNLLGVAGTSYITDGKKHAVAYSYDGSSSVTGVKIYIDGVLEPTTVEVNNLTGSIVGAGQNLFIGNQQGVTSTDMLIGTLAFFQIDNVVRSAAYIAANFVGGSIPPADANTDLRLLLNEGSGATAGDTSGHSRSGTLAFATMWVP